LNGVHAQLGKRIHFRFADMERHKAHPTNFIRVDSRSSRNSRSKQFWRVLAEYDWNKEKREGREFTRLF
jgi:hypothetical protein